MSIESIRQNLSVEAERTDNHAVEYQIHYHVIQGVLHTHYYTDDGLHQCELSGCPASQNRNSG